MAKARGMPIGYNLDVSSAFTGKPVSLGDYLDEDPAAPVAVSKPQPVSVPVDPTPTPPQAQVVPPAPVPAAKVQERRTPRAAAPVVETPVEPVPPALKPAVTVPARLRTTVPRKQINMNAETLGMVDQLMNYVETYSVEKTIKASELFNALVLCLHEAREHIDLSRVQPRGRWGSPTAAALPIALKNAFQKAIAKYNQESNQ